MLPGGVWISLLAAIIWLALPARRQSRGVQAALMLAVLCGLPTPFLWPGDTPVDPWRWWSAALWWFGSQVACRSQPTSCRQTWGRALGAFAGLQALAVADDFVTWILALELTRWGTAATSDESHDLAESGCRWLLAVGLLGWFGVTGTTSFEEVQRVLDLSYAVPVGGSSLGRPSLVLVGATAVTLFGLIAPVFLTASQHAAETSPAVWWSSLLGRQLAVGLALVGLIEARMTGLETTLVILIMVTVLCTWGVALRWLVDDQRLDRNLAGIGLMTWSLWLLTTLTYLGQPSIQETPGALVTSLIPGASVAAALLHWAVVPLGLLACVPSLIVERNGPWFRDQLRGLGQIVPFRAALFLLLLASWIGLPGTWGFWHLLRAQLALLGIHVLGSNDLILTHAGLRWFTLAAGLLLAVAISTTGQLARLLLFESPVSREIPRWRAWSLTLALLATVVVLGFGLFPLPISLE